jgi:membrane-associated phospholipid phosphatase
VRAALVATAVVAGATLLGAAASPDIDVAVARHAIRFGASIPGLDAIRAATRAAPAIVLVVALASLVRQWLRAPAARRRTRAIAIALIATFALGPGFLVNTLLKEHSHRPRPLQTAEVVGAGQSFRPFYAFDGACMRNCSFSSGEAAAAFWTVAPALAAPPAVVGPAVAIALAFGTTVSAMRMMSGAHYLSDVAFSALAMIATIAIARRISG